MKELKRLGMTAVLATAFASTQAQAACSDVAYADLQASANVVLRFLDTAGLNLNMWVTVVDETGSVCSVVNTGTKGAAAGNSQWLGSRVISAQKANTSNAFSLDGLAISTGALYAAVQPGGSLYGLQESNPVDASIAYTGAPALYGTVKDPLVGKRVGGVNVFGGGLPLYKSGKKVGAIGVSGDTSCTDHAFAWSVREALQMGSDSLPANGKVEKLNLTTTFAALGDHPRCLTDAILVGNEDFGFTTP